MAFTTQAKGHRALVEGGRALCENATVDGAKTSRGGGKLACAGGGDRWSPFPGPPPLLGSRDGALKKVIDGGK